MNPQSFLENFSTIANAPGGVQRLRGMVYQLAVQGKLVEQNMEHEHASKQLERIVQAKGESYSRNVQDLAASDNEFLEQCPLPSGWVQTTIGTIAQVVRGITFPAKEKSKQPGKNRVACLRTANIQREVEYDDILYIDKSFIKREDQYVKLGDIIMSMANSRELVGKVAQVKLKSSSPMTFGGFLGVIRPYEVSPDYLMIFLRAPETKIALIESSSQTTNIANISLGKLNPQPFPLPPLEEQQRIVAKVDQLMAVCDRLQAQQDQRSTLTTHLRKATLDALANAQPGKELQAAWNRVNANLGLLFENPEDVEELKKCVLQNAVMGKLVAQNPEDEPAAVLLQKIAAEKAALVKKGVIKKEEPLPEIREDEKPFAIPKGWEWTHFADIVNISSGVTKGRNLLGKKKISVPYLRVANVQRGYLDLQVIKEIEIAEDEINRFSLKNRDLLITEGGDWDKVGRTAIWNMQIAPCIHQNHVFRAELVVAVQNEFWLEAYLNSLSAREYFAGASKQTTNLASINKTQLTYCPIPIPPLAEQHRIVAKTQSLLAICDTLQQKISKARAIAEQLAQGVVDSITGISSEKAEKMKAPNTELVSKLRLVKTPGKKDVAPLSEQLSKHQNEMSAKALWSASGLPIDEFYKQLKIEMALGWIDEPVKAEVRIIED